MKTLVATTIALALLTSVQANATSSEISTGGSRPSIKGPASNFTGSAVIDPLYSNNEHTTNTGGLVTFEPGARSNWHTHPAGQVLIITAGTGWTQHEGGEKTVMRPGDVVWCPPDVKHWHGATDTTGVTHIAITNMRDGKGVTWLEPVTDQVYLD